MIIAPIIIIYVVIGVTF